MTSLSRWNEDVSQENLSVRRGSLSVLMDCHGDTFGVTEKVFQQFFGGERVGNLEHSG